jgi:hypothetical protein
MYYTSTELAVGGLRLAVKIQNPKSQNPKSQIPNPRSPVPCPGVPHTEKHEFAWKSGKNTQEKIKDQSSKIVLNFQRSNAPVATAPGSDRTAPVGSVARKLRRWNGDPYDPHDPNDT